jgi:SAM-dependent methyltransferase
MQRSDDAAFDPLAGNYDVDFTDTPLARYLRGRVWARLDAIYSAGDGVLEFGSGTGEDALHLLKRGVKCIPSDASAEMRTQTQRKTAVAGFPETAISVLSLHKLPNTARWPTLDGAFANFGVVNVLADLHPLAAWLADVVQPGGTVAFGVMAPRCLWEFGWHALHGDWTTATRRWRKSATFQANVTAPRIPIYYPSPRAFRGAFTPYFVQTHLEPLGLLLPPSDVYGVVERRPCLLHALNCVDDALAGAEWLAPYADHYWIELRRTGVAPA